MKIDIYKTSIYLNIYEDELNKKKYLNHLNYCKKTNNTAVVSNVGGIQTNLFLNDIDENCFFNPINEYINSFKHKSPLTWKISNLWINENKQNCFNMPHNHIENDVHFCGIWYLKCTDKSGSLCFLNDPQNSDVCNLFKFIDDPIAFANFNINPKPNLLVLFPSRLVHLVQPNFDDKDRISVAFNITLSLL